MTTRVGMTLALTALLLWPNKVRGEPESWFVVGVGQNSCGSWTEHSLIGLPEVAFQ